MIKDPKALLANLRSRTSEEEWLEFKVGTFKADEVGRYIAALANSAMLAGQRCAYMVWGVENGTHQIVGTPVRLKNEKGAGNEPFENWVTRWLDPSVNAGVKM